MAYPGYPAPSQIPGNTGSSMYPNLSGYPAQPGYPPTQAQPGYPPTQTQGGYPPVQQLGYPPAQQPSYPAPQPGYPPSQPGYGGYPPAPQTGFTGQPSYSPQGQPGYPPQGQPAYPPSGQPPYPAYPPQGGPMYPPQPNQGYPQPPRSTSPQPPYSAQPYPQPQQPSFTGYPPQPGYGAAPSPINAPVSRDMVGQPQHVPSQYSSVTRITTTSSAPGSVIGRANYHQEVLKGTPTVFPAAPFNPNDDANILRKAMKGFGTDEQAIINVLSRRTNAQRLSITMAYKTAFGKDLMSDLKSELTGKMEKVVKEMMRPLPEYHAHELHEAISGIGTTESRLVDIMCTSTNAEMYEIKAAYQRMYRKPLENDLRGDTSGHFKRLMVSMAVGNRDESNVVDPGRAQQAAQELYKAGEKQMGTDESAFNAVLATQNFVQLRLIFEEYQRLTGHSFETAVKREMSGSIEDGMLAIVKCAKHRAAYFAERLHDSMSGMGTKDELLIWLVVTRSEKDLGDVKQEYQRMYKKTLESAISGDTSGDYKKMLVALVA